MVRCQRSHESSRIDWPLAADTGSVECAVELAVRVDGRLRHRLDRRWVGNVGLEGNRLASSGLDGMSRLFGALAVRVGHRHTRPFTRERRRGRAANTRAAAGNQCHLAVEHHRAPTPARSAATLTERSLIICSGSNIALSLPSWHRRL